MNPILVAFYMNILTKRQEITEKQNREQRRETLHLAFAHFLLFLEDCPNLGRHSLEEEEEATG